MDILLKMIVDEVDPFNRECRGVNSLGARTVAAYYGASPTPGDIVLIAPTGPASWVVVTGPTPNAGLYGTGGDGAITLTRDTTPAAARTTTMSGTTSRTSTTITSTGAAFTQADVGAIITAPANFNGARIVSVEDSSHCTISHPPWNVASIASGSTLTITPAALMFVKSGSGATTTFTLQRNIYPTELVLDPSAGTFLIRTNGYGIWCSRQLFVGYGTVIHNDGSDGAALTGGAGAPAGNIFGGGGDGGNGADGAGSGDGDPAEVPSTMTNSIATTSTTATPSGGSGGNRTVTNAFGQWGSQTSNAPSKISLASDSGWPASLPQVFTLLAHASTTQFVGGNGGSGGSYRDGYNFTGTGNGGGGGGGGGIVAIYARQIINFGTIRANGGNGGPGQIVTPENIDPDPTFREKQSAGGGGGGGGGAVVLVFGAAGSNLGVVAALGGGAGSGTVTVQSEQVFQQTTYQWIVDYSLGYPQSRRIPVTTNVSAGGEGGAGSTFGEAGHAGVEGLVWIMPL